MTLDELESEANAYARSVREAGDIDWSQEAASEQKQQPPEQAFPAVGNGGRDFDDFTWRVERDVHLGRRVLMRMLSEAPGFGAGDLAWATPTEAEAMVGMEAAEYANLPVVQRGAVEQLTTAGAIRRGIARNSQ